MIVRIPIHKNFKQKEEDIRMEGVLYYSSILACFHQNLRAVKKKKTSLPAAKYVTNSIFSNCKAKLIHYPFDIPKK
jgi:hypothetical protein